MLTALTLYLTVTFLNLPKGMARRLVNTLTLCKKHRVFSQVAREPQSPVCRAACAHHNICKEQERDFCFGNYCSFPHMFDIEAL